jgi:hypothetical protein
MSGDPEPVEAEIIDIDTRQDSAGITVVLAGEFDMTAARRRLSGARSPGPEASDETGKVRMTAACLGRHGCQGFQRTL